MRCRCCNHHETTRWKGDYYCKDCKTAISNTLGIPQSNMDEAYLVEKEWDEDIRFWNKLLEEEGYE